MQKRNKHPLEIARDERAKIHPCPKCGTSNAPTGKFKIYGGECKKCGATIDCAYLFAPWSMTWDELQRMRDNFKEKYPSLTK